MHLSNIIIVLPFLAASVAAQASCEPSVFRVDQITFNACALALTPETQANPQAVLDFFKDKMGCENIIVPEARPLSASSVIRGNRCDHPSQAGKTPIDQVVPGFSVNEVMLEAPCLPGDKCAKKARRTFVA